MKRKAGVINKKAGEFTSHNRDIISEKISGFSHCSWFENVEEALVYVRKHKYSLITLGFKHAGIYDVWFNRK